MDRNLDLKSEYEALQKHSVLLTQQNKDLQRELDSFAEWRLKPINRDRDGVSVEAVTVAGNKADALRLLGWLKSEKNIAPPQRAPEHGRGCRIKRGSRAEACGESATEQLVARRQHDGQVQGG